MMLRTKNSPTMSLLEEWELREGSAATLDSLIVMMEELENASALQVLQQVKGLCVHVGFNLFLFSLSLSPFLPPSLSPSHSLFPTESLIRRPPPRSPTSPLRATGSLFSSSVERSSTAEGRHCKASSPCSHISLPSF